jgi:integrase
VAHPRNKCLNERNLTLVQLSGRVPAQALFNILERMTAFGKTGYVFKGEKEDKPFNLQVLGHALRREENQRILKKHGVKPFQPHDIRRTSATIMRRLGYGLVVDRVLAHVAKSVIDKHYDLHDYEAEKRAALDGLATYLLAIEAKSRGENVELLDSKREKFVA